jgi:CBS domain-containing protein
MRVAELMTKDPVTVGGETTLAEIVGLMDRHHINGLPVINNSNELIGMVTQGDLLRRPELGTDRQHENWFTDFFLLSRMEDDYVHTHGRHAREVMTDSPISISPNAELAEAAELMTNKHLKCLPVLRDKLLIGVISRSDIIRALAGKHVDTAEPSDAAIKNDILSTMAREHWAPKAGIRIKVKAGIVELEGAIFSDSDRRAVTVIAENALGVKRVHDHMMYVDAGSGMVFPETT